VPIEQWVAWQNEEATVPMEQWAAWQNEEATVPMEQWAAWQNEEATVPMERPITDDAVSVRCQKVMGIWQVGVIGNDEETNLLPSHESARFVGNDEETRPLFAHESAHIADNRRDIVRLRQPMSSVEAEQQLPRYCPNCNFELISAGRQSNLLYCFRCHFPISLIGGRWRLQRRLGEGTYGAAYLAENARSKAASVIKILHKDLETRLKIKDKDKREQKIEEFIWRFRQEAKIMRETGRFNHYVPRIYGDGMDENFGYYIAMEYLAGQTLDEIRFAPENRRQILLVFRELCKAMDAIHNCGIVHRDLKPENILLIKKANGSFRLVVFDFGIAKVLGESGLIKTYFPLGTPLYISPEQIRCTYIDRRTDIYAMGIMLYQMLTDKQLFEGTDVESMIIAHIGHPVINMRLRRPDLNIPAGLDDAVCKAVAKNSYERYDSAMDFWNAVAPFCE
jgi:tRNA A-37 threonylcarbamoyl transferase component Bud32